MSSESSSRAGGRDAEVSRIEQEVAALQRHMLPTRGPDLPGYRFAAFYRPCEAAGGDFYGFQAFDDGRLGFVIADVAGHGAAAAVMMAVLRASLASFRVFGRLRETAAQDVNMVLREVSVPGVFVTAFFGSLEPSTGTVYSGNCGHPTPLLRTARGVTRLEDLADVPLGVLDRVSPPMVTSRLAPGDALVLYTDGIVEMQNARGDFFGLERLTRAVERSPRGDAESVLASVTAAVADHAAGAAPLDDQCVLVCSRDAG